MIKQVSNPTCASLDQFNSIGGFTSSYEIKITDISPSQITCVRLRQSESLHKMRKEAKVGDVRLAKPKHVTLRVFQALRDESEAQREWDFRSLSLALFCRDVAGGPSIVKWSVQSNLDSASSPYRSCVGGYNEICLVNLPAACACTTHYSHSRPCCLEWTRRRALQWHHVKRTKLFRRSIVDHPQR